MFQCSPALIRLAALATFPEGKVWGAFRSAARAKATAAYQREGQAPPLRYDEIRRITYYLESRLLAAAPGGASIRSAAENCHFFTIHYYLLLPKIGSIVFSEE